VAVDHDHFHRWVPPPPDPAPMSKEKELAIAKRLESPPLCECGVAAEADYSGTILSSFVP
jgi:hypothetical protein